MIQRRKVLADSARLVGLLMAAGLLPQVAQAAWSKEAFDAKTFAEAIKALGGAAPTASKEVSITGPDIAENGAVVPVVAASTLAGIRRLAILVEKNPNALAASFEVNDTAEANVSTRIKMGQTSNVLAVAMMADGRVLYAQKEIKVTQGGCGG